MVREFEGGSGGDIAGAFLEPRYRWQILPMRLIGNSETRLLGLGRV